MNFNLGNMLSGGSRGAKDQAKKAIKKKILLWMAPALPFILLGFIGIVVVISVVFSFTGPSVMAKESVDAEENSKASFFERFSNFFSGNGWTDDETAFFNIIQDSGLGCKSSAVVTETLMYYRQFNPDKGLEYGDIPSEPGEDEEITRDESGDNMYDNVEYGKMLPDLKRLVTKIRRGEAEYEKYVKNTFLKKAPYNEMLEGYDDQEARADEIYDDIINLADTVGCSDSITNGAICSYNLDVGAVNDLKVRLLHCGNVGGGYAPLEDEELVDFEKYILGVVYQEVGGAPVEALKTQAIAARSFSLRRGEAMNYVAGIGKIEQIDGQWVISLRSCTDDQVYCDPDKGCWSNVRGGQTQTGPGAYMDATVHSGANPSAAWSRPPLTMDSPIRKAVMETAGMVAIGSDQKVFYTNFASNEQDNWAALANSGLDFRQILSRQYNDVTVAMSNCTSMGPGLAAADSTGFRQRTGQPNKSDSFWFSNQNLSYAGGYTGQCTWYAFGRANEVLSLAGSNLKWNIASDAGRWFNDNLSNGEAGFKSSRNVNEPKPGAIIVWENPGKPGHVGFVEAVNEDGTINYSEANIGSARSESNPYGFRYNQNVPLSTIEHVWPGYNFIGYIYMLN